MKRIAIVEDDPMMRNEFIDENALQVNLTRLKKTMRSLGMEQQIVSVRGIGYHLQTEESHHET